MKDRNVLNYLTNLMTEIERLKRDNDRLFLDKIDHGKAEYVRGYAAAEDAAKESQRKVALDETTVETAVQFIKGKGKY